MFLLLLVDCWKLTDDSVFFYETLSFCSGIQIGYLVNTFNDINFKKSCSTCLIYKNFLYIFALEHVSTSCTQTIFAALFLYSLRQYVFGRYKTHFVNVVLKFLMSMGFHKFNPALVIHQLNRYYLPAEILNTEDFWLSLGFAPAFTCNY